MQLAGHHTPPTHVSSLQVAGGTRRWRPMPCRAAAAIAGAMSHKGVQLPSIGNFRPATRLIATLLPLTQATCHLDPCLWPAFNAAVGCMAWAVDVLMQPVSCGTCNAAYVLWVLGMRRRSARHVCWCGFHCLMACNAKRATPPGWSGGHIFSWPACVPAPPRPAILSSDASTARPTVAKLLVVVYPAVLYEAGCCLEDWQQKLVQHVQ